MKSEWRLFGLITLFCFVVAPLYAWWTWYDSNPHVVEWVGTVGLILVGLLTAMCAGFFLVVSRCTKDGIGERLPGTKVPGRHDVLEHSQVWKEADVLKRARNAEARDLVRLAPANGSAREQHLAVGRVVDAGQEIEDGGFSRAVGANQSVQRPRFHPHRQRLHGGQAAELLGDGACLQQGSHDLIAAAGLLWPRRRSQVQPISRRPNNPCGRKIIVRISSRA